MNFKKIEDYKKFLEKKAAEISQKREYDFRVHYIDIFGKDYRSYIAKSKNNEICETDAYEIIAKQKAESIINNGLYLCNSSISYIPYTSINGTSKFVTESQEFDAQSIIDYKYTSSEYRDRMVVILAVPKFIHHKGKKIEFSCYKNVRALDDPKFLDVPELNKAYSNFKDIRFANFGLLDCILGTTFPKEYVLGAQFISKKNNTAYFIENPNHLSNLSEEKFEEFKSNVALRVARTGLNDNASNLLDIMVKTTKAEYDYYTNREFEDF